MNPWKSLNGAISRILNGPGAKSRLFEGPETFLALLNGTSDSEGHFGGQKSHKYVDYWGGYKYADYWGEYKFVDYLSGYKYVDYWERYKFFMPLRPT